VRHLGARLDANGSLVIEGQDIGPGMREYEWAWTIPPEGVSRLLLLIGGDENVLAAIAARFSGDAAGEVVDFLDSNGIPYEVWSRVGE
jgi:hypothetical protein